MMENSDGDDDDDDYDEDFAVETVDVALGFDDDFLGDGVCRTNVELLFSKSKRSAALSSRACRRAALDTAWMQVLCGPYPKEGVELAQTTPNGSPCMQRVFVASTDQRPTRPRRT